MTRFSQIFIIAGACLLLPVFCTVSGAESAPDSTVKAPAASRPTPGGHFAGILEEIRRKNPQEYRRLQNLRLSNRKEFFREMRALMPQDARKRFYARYRELENRKKELAGQYQQTADPEKKAELLQELKKAIAESHSFFVADMKKRLDQMQKKIDQMEANSDRIQEQQLQRLLKRSGCQ